MSIQDIPNNPETEKAMGVVVEPVCENDPCTCETEEEKECCDKNSKAEEEDERKAQLFERVEHDFTYHAPVDEEQVRRYALIRAKAKELAKLFVSLVPPGREQSKALTDLEQSVMFANAGIARHYKP